MKAARLNLPTAGPSADDPRTASFGDILASARLLLVNAGVDSPWLTAIVLLEAATGLPRARLLASSEQRPTDSQQAHFRRLLERRCAREPLAHILGYREFYGRRFAVSSAVLTPRPETEGLVQLAIERLDRKGIASGHALLDVGTGSGAIAVAVLAARGALVAVATDTSIDALALARENARPHGVSARLHLVACDLAASVSTRFPVVVANLPYIPSRQIPELEPEVARYEPRQALDGGADGTEQIRRLIPELDRLLTPGGAAFLEIGEGQADALERYTRRVLAQYEVAVRRDATGAERYLIVERRSS